MSVPKSCPFCGRPSKSWHETIEHVNLAHWHIQTDENFIGEYCGKCQRFFPSGRQAMIHVLDRHKTRARQPASPYANTEFARNKT